MERWCKMTIEKLLRHWPLWLFLAVLIPSGLIIYFFSIVGILIAAITTGIVIGFKDKLNLKNYEIMAITLIILGLISSILIVFFINTQLSYPETSFFVFSIPGGISWGLIPFLIFLLMTKRYKHKIYL